MEHLRGYLTTSQSRAHHLIDAISWTSVIVGSLLLLVAYYVVDAIYSVTLHPLARFPGPMITAISRIPYWKASITGDQVYWLQSLHARYGPVVRFSPNDLSYVDCDGQTWKEIHGHEKGKNENPKAREFHMPPPNGTPNVITADLENHRRVRKLLSPAFSDRALKSQETMFLKHVDLMVSQTRRAGKHEQVVDMAKMINFTTFDIMGDLCFGQPLGLLERTEYSPWVSAVFDSVRILPVVWIIEYYPWLSRIFRWIEPKAVKDMKQTHWNHTVERVNRRLEQGSTQPDVWNLAIPTEAGTGLTVEEMHSNGELFMLAGTETSATLLTGLLYYLLVNPDKMHFINSEVRGSFAAESEMSMERLAGLRYVNACIQEALRIYPPLPIGIPRFIPEGGQIILGKYIAAGTRVTVQNYVTSHSPLNFRDPNTFAPERWLGDPAYEGDSRVSCQPFSFGPRNCIGQNMAMHEMRMILAKLLFNFDIELCEDIKWIDQKIYGLWEKKPLRCRVVAR